MIMRMLSIGEMNDWLSISSFLTTKFSLCYTECPLQEFKGKEKKKERKKEKERKRKEGRRIREIRKERKNST